MSFADAATVQKRLHGDIKSGAEKMLCHGRISETERRIFLSPADAAQRAGTDVDDVEAVFNYDLPSG